MRLLLVSLFTSWAFGGPAVSLSQLRYSGTGCPAGSTSSLFSPDGEVLTLLFSDYVASPNEIRSCAIDFELSYEPGWAFAVYRTDLRGYATAESGASALQDVGFRIGNGPYHLFATQTLRGQYDSNYFFRYVVGGSDLSFSSCPSTQQRIKLRTSLRTLGNAVMTVDSIDGSVEQQYRIAWKRCGDAPPGAGTLPLYRAYNPNADSHFYTTNPYEYRSVVARGYRGEGVAVLVSRTKSHPSLSAIHRLYNPNNGRHYYTTNSAEKNSLVTLGWRHEKDEGYLYVTQVVGTEVVNRLYNQKTGGHLFTANEAEAHYLLSYPGTPWKLHSPLGYGLTEIE
ncbi:MAG: DUF4360 domain-containing protein [Deltaproteobacteria bacterium]|nr:DUF4360 domain-containing protein [Deltaproteobacteria bacterium]